MVTSSIHSLTTPLYRNQGRTTHKAALLSGEATVWAVAAPVHESTAGEGGAPGAGAAEGPSPGACVEEEGTGWAGPEAVRSPPGQQGQYSASLLIFGTVPNLAGRNKTLRKLFS